VADVIAVDADDRFQFLRTDGKSVDAAGNDFGAEFLMCSEPGRPKSCSAQPLIPRVHDRLQCALSYCSTFG